MNVRDWPMDRIMQLPDHCFGRRWLVSCCCRGPNGETVWDIAELAFPESIVIWEFGVWLPKDGNIGDGFRVALGDQLPTTTAQMDALEPLFPGLGVQGAGPRSIWLPHYTSVVFRRLRQGVRTSGRRLVLELNPAASIDRAISMAVVVSSIPTEVPDCYA